MVVFRIVGVSPEALSRTSVVQLQTGIRNVQQCLYNTVVTERIPFQVRFPLSRRDVRETEIWGQSKNSLISISWNMRGRSFYSDPKFPSEQPNAESRKLTQKGFWVI
jgi:hypothetical protein